MTIKNNRFYKKFKSLTTTSDIEEEKKKRIKAGSGERMRTVGSKGSPTAANFKRAAKTAKKTTKKKRK